MNAMLINPRVELAQFTPSLLYIADASSGKPALRQLLRKSLPASTLAAYSGYASDRQLRTALKSRNAPTLNQDVPMMGTI